MSSLLHAVEVASALAGVAIAIGACSGEPITDSGRGDAQADASTGGAGADAWAAETAGPDSPVDAHDANPDVPDVPDASGSCSLLDEAAFTAAQAKSECTAYFGWKVPGGPKQFVTCDEYCVGGAVTSCGVSPAGECWKFPDTCVPSGWTSVFECLLNAPPVCAGAMDGGS